MAEAENSLQVCEQELGDLHGLKGELESVRTANSDLRKEMDKLRTSQQKAAFNELVYVVVVQSILSHKKQDLTIPQRKKLTTRNTLRWLTQRKNVINYLRTKRQFEDYADLFESLLFVERPRLEQLVEQFKY